MAEHPIRTAYAGRPSVFRLPSTHAALGHTAHQIAERLYLGSAAAARSDREALRALGITAIVNCTRSYQIEHAHKGDDSIAYMRVDVEDQASVDLLPYFRGATGFIGAQLAAGGAVLVHCQAGVSRSASVVISFLMRATGATRDSAYAMVKARRTLADPNLGFWAQLLDWERRLAASGVDGEDDADARCELDEAWVRRSLAEFAVPGEEGAARAFRALSAGDGAAATTALPAGLDLVLGRSGTGATRALPAGLDFVCGRGVGADDMQWFSALLIAVADRATEASAAGCAEFVASTLANEEWLADWGSDLRACDLRALAAAVRAAAAHAPALWAPAASQLDGVAAYASAEKKKRKEADATTAAGGIQD